MKKYGLLILVFNILTLQGALAESVRCVGFSEVQKSQTRVFEMEVSGVESGSPSLVSFRGSKSFGTGYTDQTGKPQRVIFDKDGKPEVMIYNDFNVTPRRISFPKAFYTVGTVSILTIFNMHDEQLHLRIENASKDAKGLTGLFTVADHDMVMVDSGKIQCAADIEKK